MPILNIDEGDTLWLSYGYDSRIIDYVVINTETSVTSLGRFPNGTGDFEEMIPTQTSENIASSRGLINDEVFVYPNPAGHSFNVKTNQDLPCDIDLYTLDGRQMFTSKSMDGQETITIDSSTLAEGIYLVQVGFGTERITKRIMITH